MLCEGLRLLGKPSLDNTHHKKNVGRVHSHQPVKEILKAVPQTASVVTPALLGIVFLCTMRGRKVYSFAHLRRPGCL